MKKGKIHIRQIIAGVLVASMLITQLPASFVYAAEEKTVEASEEPYLEENEEWFQSNETDF